jgi:DNA-directed RNA polymerase sigma subunit (sigma70/sigma32)
MLGRKYMENPIQKQERAIRNRKIAKMYPRKTLQAIGDKYGISRERVRQILLKVKQ